MPAILEDHHVRQLITYSASWRLLGLCFETPSPDRRDHMAAILKESPPTDLTRAARETLRVSQGEYQALFGPGGAVSPREVAYVGMQDPGQLIADLRGFYEAFAYRSTVPEPADHLAIESGFLGYLTLKSAFAQANADDQSLQLSDQARQDFIRSHFARFARGFSERLIQFPDHPFLPLGEFMASQGDWQEVRLAAF